jgi:hypothetical protein
MTRVSVNIAVEDALSESILRKLLKTSKRGYLISGCFCRGGFGYLKKQINSFNLAARFKPFIVLTDLDRSPCPPALIDDWLQSPRHSNLLLRIAVHEVESWLLADHEGMSGFFKTSKDLMAITPDEIPDPKAFLINLARRSFRELRNDIVPREDGTSRQGPNYNGRMCEFVEIHWSFKRAMRRSPSLARAVRAIESFEAK